MLHVFCDKKGSGKTKALIQSANEKINMSKGNIVYIDDDSRRIFQLDRRIRFISTNEFELKNYSNFYGFLCGILSEDYDVSTIYIDGLFNIVERSVEDAAHLFYAMEKLAHKHNVDFYLNVSIEKDTMPDFIKKYVA